jgi:hypothetical protein
MSCGPEAYREVGVYVEACRNRNAGDAAKPRLPS